MGFQSAWKYETVIELVFETGTLIHEFDRSDRMTEFRKMVDEAHSDESSTGELPKEEIERFQQQAFHHRYHLHVEHRIMRRRR